MRLIFTLFYHNISQVTFRVMFYLCMCVCVCVCVSTSVPGDIRNDLYLTLERGDFERGGKSVQKNIEVTVYVLYADGEILKVLPYHRHYKPSLHLKLH